MIGKLRGEILPKILLVLLSALIVWLHSGTLAPYAASLFHDFIVRDPLCGYLFNLDHSHFVQTDLMIGGYPPRDWSESVLLRLVGYPILSRPFTAAFGFLWGRVLLNILIYSLCSLWLYELFRRKLARGPATLLALTTMSFPGFAYWGGLPYHYALIAPLSLWLYYRLEIYLEKGEQGKDLWRLAAEIALASLFYEVFLPVFLLVLSLLILKKRHWRSAPLAYAILLGPSIVVNFALSFFVPVANSNNATYGNIIKSYLSLPDWAAWGKLLAQVPGSLVSVFFDSGFFFLPLSFLLMTFVSRLEKRKGFAATDLFFASGFLALFAFVNLAPPHPGWQMRGDWIARLYMPLFAIYIFYFLRSLSANSKKFWNLKIAILGFCLFGHLITVSGGISGMDKTASLLYYRFYKHAPEAFYGENLENFGRYPIGFCKNQNKNEWETRRP
jgi:hypothetical protein